LALRSTQTGVSCSSGQRTSVHAFLCAITGGEPQVPREEISELLWADPQRLPEPVDMVGPFAIADAQAENWGVVREALPWKRR
jgi:hypothetical protein